MIIEFKIKNYKSFKDETLFSMIATSSMKENLENTSEVNDKLRLLKSSALYGANGSGKSNFFIALRFMKNFIISSAKDGQAEEAIKAEPFIFSDSTIDEPSGFEVTFLHERSIYRYGFLADQYKIHEEWLYHTPKKRELKLFTREEQAFDCSKKLFTEGLNLSDKTRKNALFLSLNAMLNGPTSTKVLTWFNNLNIISGIHDNNYANFTIHKVKDNEDYRKKTTLLLKSVGISLESLNVKTLKINEASIPEFIPPDIRKGILEESTHQIEFQKQKYGEDGKVIGTIPISIGHESQGTQKIFHLSGPLFNTLQEGRLLIIDELDARLHPLITKAIVKLFHSKENNPHNAQLIFATHDTNLLSNDLFRRDQIWFVEKDRNDASHLYSLSDFKTEKDKKIRNDANYEKNYIAGKFGAIPYINREELDLFLNNG